MSEFISISSNELSEAFAKSQVSQRIYNPDAFTLQEIEHKFSCVYELPKNSPERAFIPWFHYAAIEYLNIAINKRTQLIKNKYCD